MKFNPDFIRAVALVQSAEGDAMAERVFNALFVVPAIGAGAAPSTLLTAARAACGASIYGSDIRAINVTVGTPYIGWDYAVPWIKEARARICCGLKEAKDLHDFVRDNPTVAQA
jgi:ribosomal protein L7/L12